MTAAKKKPAKKQAAKPKTKAKEKQPANATEEFMPAILCAHTKLVPIESLKRHPRNPNTHPDSQIKLLANIIAKSGFRSPIVVSNRSGFITKGHGRLDAAERYGRDRIIVFPYDNVGTCMHVRNWAKEYTASLGHHWHWQLDDDIMKIGARTVGKVVHHSPCEVFREIEAFVHQYENIAIAGICGGIFQFSKKTYCDWNTQAVSCVLVNNDVPIRWRLSGHMDTDYTLQALSLGWCTVQINKYGAWLEPSGQPGGMTPFYNDSGRLRRVRALMKAWPNLNIRVGRRNGRPTAITSGIWRHFKNKPIRVNGK